MKIPDDCIKCVAECICPTIVIRGDSACQNFHKALESKLKSKNLDRTLSETSLMGDYCMEYLAFMYIQSKNVNGQPILKRVYKKEYVARRVNGESAVEILEEKLTSDNAIKATICKKCGNDMSVDKRDGCVSNYCPWCDTRKL